MNLPIYKVHMYNSNKELIKTVRIHAWHFSIAGSIAMKRYPELEATYTLIRIK